MLDTSTPPPPPKKKKGKKKENNQDIPLKLILLLGTNTVAFRTYPYLLRPPPHPKQKSQGVDANDSSNLLNQDILAPYIGLPSGTGVYDVTILCNMKTRIRSVADIPKCLVSDNASSFHSVFPWFFKPLFSPVATVFFNATLTFAWPNNDHCHFLIVF